MQGADVMLRHEYVDHVAALCAAAMAGHAETPPWGKADVVASVVGTAVAIAEALAAARFDGPNAPPREVAP
jgi:hypothetical protein